MTADKTFEERAREWFEPWAREATGGVFGDPSKDHAIDRLLVQIAVASANWGRTEGIRECIEALKKSEDCGADTPEFWADWLAGRLLGKEGKDG